MLFIIEKERSFRALKAVTLLVGWQEGHPACRKNWVVRYWLAWSGARCKWFCIWSSWCHCHPIISCSSKIQNDIPFWCQLTQVVLEKRPLNGCCVVVVIIEKDITKTVH